MSFDSRTLTEPVRRFLGTKQMAATINIHVDTLKRWAARGIVPQSLRVNGRVLRWDYLGVIEAISRRSVSDEEG